MLCLTRQRFNIHIYRSFASSTTSSSNPNDSSNNNSNSHSESNSNSVSNGRPFYQTSLMVLVGLIGGITAVKQWDNYYEERNLVHPITAFIARNMQRPEKCREERIADITEQVRLAEGREKYWSFFSSSKEKSI